MKTCPFCGNGVTVNGRGRHCPTCGGAVRSCHVCASIVAFFARFCRHCGVKQTPMNLTEIDDVATRFTRVWEESLVTRDDVIGALVLDRFFIAAGSKDWWLYTPFAPRAVRRAVRAPDALVDRPAVVGQEVLFPCANGLWAIPIGQIFRAQGPALEPERVWAGELQAWWPEDSTATVVDARGAVVEIEERRVNPVDKLPWPPRQLVRFRDKIVGVGPLGLCSVDSTLRMTGNIRLLGATDRALLLLDGHRLLFAWEDGELRSMTLGERFADGFFVERPRPDGVVIAIPEADSTPRVFRVRFPHAPEPSTNWEFPASLWLPTHGQPVSGSTFVLASRDVNTRVTRLRAYSVLPTDGLGIPRNSDTVEGIVAGPFLAGRVVYLVATANGLPVVQCYHLFPADR